MSKVVVGNWKMFPTLSDSVVLAGALKRGLETLGGVEVVIAPPTAWLIPVHEHWRHRPKHVHFAAQNIWPEDQGAFTGETSAYLLKDIVSYAIVGHSERRAQGEDNDLVSRKLHAALKWHLTPVVCIGETKRALFTDGTVDPSQWRRLTDQLSSLLEGISATQLEKIVISYEPVWAVGTSNPANPDYAHKMIERLAGKVAEKYGQTAAGNLRFLYGGSVNASNAVDYLRYPNIAGVMPGSASVKAKEFIRICDEASRLR